MGDYPLDNRPAGWVFGQRGSAMDRFHLGGPSYGLLTAVVAAAPLVSHRALQAGGNQPGALRSGYAAQHPCRLRQLVPAPVLSLKNSIIIVR